MASDLLFEVCVLWTYVGAFVRYPPFLEAFKTPVLTCKTDQPCDASLTFEQIASFVFLVYSHATYVRE